MTKGVQFDIIWKHLKEGLVIRQKTSESHAEAASEHENEIEKSEKKEVKKYWQSNEQMIQYTSPLKESKRFWNETKLQKKSVKAKTFENKRIEQKKLNFR